MAYVKLSDGTIVKSHGTPTTQEKSAAIVQLQTEKDVHLAQAAEYTRLAEVAQSRAESIQVTIDELRA